MSKQAVAINVSEINSLMVEILDYSSKIKTIFLKINDLVDGTKSYYDCSSASLLRNKYNLFSNNYNVIVSNIMSYNRDLSNLKKKYALGLDDLSQEIKRDALKINDVKDYKERR